MTQSSSNSTASTAPLVYIYARVSDTDNEEESSVTDQVREGREFVTKKWPRAKIIVFREVQSAATISKRLEFCKLLGQVSEEKPIAVVVRDQDRLSRQTQEMLQLHHYLCQHGVEVWLYRNNEQIRTDTPQSEMMLTLMSSVSTFERKMTAARTKAKIISMRNQGKYTGGKTPKGYAIDASKRLVPSGEAEAVRRVFKVAAETKSLAEAYRASKKEGLWTDKQSVQYALKNPIYVGAWIKPDGEELKNHHEALIGEDIFRAAQVYVRRRFLTHVRKHEKVFELEGLVRCEHCKRFMTNKHVKKKNGLRIFYYECTKAGRECPIKRISARDFEEWVWLKLKQLCQQPEILRGALEEYDSSRKPSPVELGRIGEIKETLKSDRVREKTIKAFMASLFEHGKQPALSYNDDLAAIESRIVLLEAELEEAKAKANPAEKLNANRFLAALRAALENPILETNKRRAVVQSLLKQITVSERDVRLTLLQPCEVFESRGAMNFEDKFMSTLAGKDAKKSGSHVDPKWLPDLDSNQKPSH